MILVDPPNSPGHGRLWSHLASDTSFEELHAFALALGVPQRGFDRDHYDVPEEWYDTVVAAGAVPVSSRELLERLRASGLRRPKPHTLAPRRPGRRLLRPPRLRPGDVVAVVAPAGPIPPAGGPERVQAGAARLEEWGLRVRFGDAAPHPTLSWLAARDEDRAEQLQWALTDPGVAAVWAARGGYGTQRVLDLLDWDVVSEAAPRLLVGFSDLTALHQAAAARLGLATLHAPGVGGLADGEPTSLERVRALVFGGAGQVLHGRRDPRFGVTGGVVEGVTVGGNLTVLATSVGTGHLRPAADQIAVLEDIGERPYRLDRSLTQLVRSGWFDGVRGIALGRFTDCGDPEQVDTLLAERLAPLGVPVLAGLPFGHDDQNHPVPLGVRATLDVAAGTLEIEAPVR